MMVLVVTLTPAMSILLVSGRQPIYNLFLFFERASELLGIAIPLWLLRGSSADVGQTLIQIGVGVALLTAVTHIAAASFAFSLGSSFRPTLRIPQRSELLAVLRRIGWSSLQTVSMNLYVRADVLIVAAFAGPAGTVALGIALRLMGYVRQATMGLVNGLDAVIAANINGQRRRSKHSGVNHDGAIDRHLIATSTALQANVVFQLLVMFLLLGSDFVNFWVGDLLTETGRENGVAEITALSAVMIVGMGFRSLNLGWMSAMTGSGNARHFTPWLLPGALANVAILSTWALLSPQTFSLMVVGIVFLVLQIITHGLIIPIASAQSLGVGFLVPDKATIHTLRSCCDELRTCLRIAKHACRYAKRIEDYWSSNRAFSGFFSEHLFDASPRAT